MTQMLMNYLPIYLQKKWFLRYLKTFINQGLITEKKLAGERLTAMFHLCNSSKLGKIFVPSFYSLDIALSVIPSNTPTEMNLMKYIDYGLYD